MNKPLVRAKTARHWIVFASCLFLSQTVLAQSKSDIDEFSSVLFEFAQTIDDSHAIPYGDLGMTREVLSLSDQELRALYSAMPDPDFFMHSAKTVIANGALDLTIPRNEKSFGGLMGTKSHPAATGFSPDYPSGGSYDAFIATLPGLGLLDFGKTNRTDANAVGQTYIAFHTLEFVALAAQAVCDASLLGAPVACPLAGVANAAAMATQVVLNQTAYQDGLIDGAEIEASYENTVILIGQQNHLATDLGTHDTAITSQLTLHDADIKNVVSIHDTDLKAALNTHDTDIKALLANVQAGVDANGARLDILLARQLEVIRLLHTPQGLRTTDVPACGGAACVWNP